MRQFQDPGRMTNRELFTEYESAEKDKRYALVVEMAKRIGFRMITPEVVAVFSQYKLNGAGDEYR